MGSMPSFQYYFITETRTASISSIKQHAAVAMYNQPQGPQKKQGSNSISAKQLCGSISHPPAGPRGLVMLLLLLLPITLRLPWHARPHLFLQSLTKQTKTRRSSQQARNALNPRNGPSPFLEVATPCPSLALSSNHPSKNSRRHAPPRFVAAAAAIDARGRTLGTFPYKHCARTHIFRVCCLTSAARARQELRSRHVKRRMRPSNRISPLQVPPPPSVLSR
jgi:hypothetical protein